MSRPFGNQASSSSTLLPARGGFANFDDGSSLRSSHPSIAEKYSLSPSPKSWGMPLLMNTPEDDDYLHNPDPTRDRKSDRGGAIFTLRGLANLGCLFILAAGMLGLSFSAGYPIISTLTKKLQSNQGGFNLGGTNATGQIAEMAGNFGLIDSDTPKDAYTKTSVQTGEELTLVFSDEFNVDGRTFYPGDDPYWEAVDFHYWGTNDLEWYDPKQATTGNGSLLLTLDYVSDSTTNHDLSYVSGMIQSWNKFCFTGGLIEASIRLPGSSSIKGLWPGFWTMGNLGRAGYGATNDGTWPYSYDACDVGTLPNQTYPGTALPEAAVTNGDAAHFDMLSYLPGQRLSACTCAGESHPGPIRSDGSYVGRSAPEIDVIEATVENNVGKVSLSAQWAPFNAEYKFLNNSDTVIFYDEEVTHLNSYAGGAYQQTTSGLAITNQSCYELSGGCFSTYGFEYKPGFDDAYITWISSGVKAWTIFGAGMGKDAATEISARPVPQEPMYIITNLGFSLNFGDIEFEQITFPTTMSIDYIRVYQPKDSINTGCDPKDFPTAAYIEAYKGAYTNPNFTTWEQFGQPWPKNSLDGGC
ncbi:glucosidase [Cyathus striatus]|nr:glucosidase [Cyathus striatus]